MIAHTNVLTIDDDASILAAYESILVPNKKTSLEDALLELEKLHEIECSVVNSGEKLLNFNLYQANNGMDGIDIFRQKYEEGSNIPVCIVDMRMPNGINGLETSLWLKQIDPDVHIIIATAYSDRSNKEILACLKNNIYYIRKPFNSEEIYQLVYSLSISYEATRKIQRLNSDLERRVEDEIEKNRQKDSLLFQQAKLAAMGEMIGNIAHQWRQPLNIISMLFQKVYRQQKKGTLDTLKMKSTLNQAMETINHMSQTIDDFRGHFEPNKEKVHFTVLSVVQGVISIVEESFKIANIEIQTYIQPEITLHTYPEDLKQVLMNLLNNTKDAIKSNNVLRGVVRFDVLITKNSEISINFSDNAGGISDEHIDKIFEPYFTTKHKSQGTGIGLYMSKRIVEERLGGTISVSNTDIGANFNISIPIQNITKDN
ncbi:MAG: hybrid sensor histidine kinase/response regulator [Sulfurimonas sp.]|jgi:signal transduction histidine kinase